MKNGYLSAKKEAMGIYEEKKSVFYGYIKPCETEADALEFIKKIKAENEDMKHVCYAYTNLEGNIVRFSDDGEPQGTAGVPILDVIKRENLSGVAICVARYFGGILLGAGGLVRAYGKAAKAALDESGIAEFVLYSVVKVTCDYSAFQKIKYELEKKGFEICDLEYGENITFSTLAVPDEESCISSLVSDTTAGRGKCEKISEKFAPKK